MNWLAVFRQLNTNSATRSGQRLTNSKSDDKVSAQDISQEVVIFPWYCDYDTNKERYDSSSLNSLPCGQ